MFIGGMLKTTLEMTNSKRVINFAEVEYRPVNSRASKPSDGFDDLSARVKSGDSSTDLA